jgi:hypothetical protein
MKRPWPPAFDFVSNVWPEYPFAHALMYLTRANVRFLRRMELRREPTWPRIGLGPVTSVGEVTYDGKGNSNATYTLSANGTIHPVTVAGTYIVKPADCTATAVEAPSHFNFVIAPDGNTVWWLSTDPGTVLSGTLVRPHPLESFEDASRHRSTNQRAVPANLHSAPAANALPNPKIQQTAQRLPAVSKAS